MMEKFYQDLDKLVDLLTDYAHLSDKHLNEYFTNDLHHFIVNETFCEESYMQQCQDIGALNCCLQVDTGCCVYCNEAKWLDDRKQASKENKFASEKKQHEVGILANHVADMALNANCSNVVDFGSGKGYLGSELLSTFRLNVVGIEGRLRNIASSEKRFSKIQKENMKKEMEICKTIMVDIKPHILPSSHHFVEDIKKQFLLYDTDAKGDALLIGLHSCGNLTNMALQLFVKESYFKGLMIVGCCYNLLSVNVDFPMSDYLKQKNVRITQNALMLACQSPAKWSNDGQILSKSILYRAILEEILTDQNINRNMLQKIRLRNLGKRSSNFTEYVEGVKSRFANAGILFKMKAIETYWKKYEGSWDRLQKYHWLRMQLAPCIEKLIISDRLCFLLEQGFRQCCAVRMFEPVISPRCYAIACRKDGVV